MRAINVIFLKELEKIDEIFNEGTKLPNLIKKAILFLKKMLCVATIKQDGTCILPYKNLESFFKIKLFLIKKIVIKLNMPIVLSNHLDNIENFKKEIIGLNIEIIDGKKLSNYLIPEIIEYICKIRKEEKQKQEITLLIENKTIDISKLIIDLAKEVKRIHIVTTKIREFKMLENDLENKLGLACQITNNKRKSLSKSKIIINFDFSLDLLNQYTINSNAIVIDINKKVNICSKAFSGIHIYDYYIHSNNIKNDIFETKKICEAKLQNKNYEQIRKMIKEENIKIINLVGRKGIIHRDEYTRV